MFSQNITSRLKDYSGFTARPIANVGDFVRLVSEVTSSQFVADMKLPSFPSRLSMIQTTRVETVLLLQIIGLGSGLVEIIDKWNVGAPGALAVIAVPWLLRSRYAGIYR